MSWIWNYCSGIGVGGVCLGRETGNAQSLITVVQHVLRPYDQLYRYGGEEFLICMPNTTLEQAEHVAERIRSMVAEQQIIYDKEGNTLQVTASIGVTSLDPAYSVDDAINKVDEAMYEAKSIFKYKSRLMYMKTK